MRWWRTACYWGISYNDLLELKDEFSEVGLLTQKIWTPLERFRAAHEIDLMNLSAQENHLKFFKGHKGLFNAAERKGIEGAEDQALRIPSVLMNRKY